MLDGWRAGRTGQQASRPDRPAGRTGRTGRQAGQAGRPDRPAGRTGRTDFYPREIWLIWQPGSLAAWQPGSQGLCTLFTLFDPGKCRRPRSAAWRTCPIPIHTVDLKLQNIFLCNIAYRAYCPMTATLARGEITCKYPANCKEKTCATEKTMVYSDCFIYARRACS